MKLPGVGRKTANVVVSVSYPEQVKLAGGVPVMVEGKEENEYKITSGQLEEVLSSKTKALILNSPSNPTGMLYSEEELRAIGEACRRSLKKAGMYRLTVRLSIRWNWQKSRSLRQIALNYPSCQAPLMSVM